MHFSPKTYQAEAITWIVSNDRSALFSPMGSGKTICTLTALEVLSLEEAVYPVLILAPLHVARHTWPDEVKKWSHTSHLKTSVIAGTAKERKLALGTLADVYTTNYENLPWLVEELGQNWPFKTVIADESTKLKGFRLRQGTKRAKALAQVAHTKIKRMLLLTGTPAPNGLLDLWGQVWFVDKGQRLGKNFSAFTDRWFDSDYMGYTLTPKVASQGEIQNLIKDVCMTVDISRHMPVDLPIVNKIVLDLPPKANIQYKKMEKEMFLQLETEGIEALSTAVARGKCAQIAAGAIYLEDKTWEIVHDAKLEALRSIIEEAGGMPVLVAYRFKSDLGRLRSAFPSGRAIFDDPTIIQRWNQGELPILFAHPKSAGHGLNLQMGSNILAFFSMGESLEEHLQIIERIGPLRQKQAGLNRPVFVHYLIMRDTVDEIIFESLETKKSVQEVLLKAFTSRKT